MPELAEVEYFRKRWSVGHGAKVLTVHMHAEKKIFRQCDPAVLAKKLKSARLMSSETAGKQMLFRFSGKNWLGIHLGMSGELRAEPRGYVATKHDHLILEQAKRKLVFNDPRMFGAIRFASGATAPDWWTKIAPAILSKAFTLEVVTRFLKRRSRAPIKAVLLMQEGFPGIGNWMADEILWRAAIHPKQSAGSLTETEVRALHREAKRVCRLALDKIAGRGDYLPAEHNMHIPKTWLFPHRWRKGGHCPRTGVPLRHGVVGGRTTCWSPARQKLHS